LAVFCFFQYFIDATVQQTHLEWEKKDDNFEQIVVHLNYQAVHASCNGNVRQFLDFIGEHPNDVNGSLALALDSVRLYAMQEDKDQRRVIVRFYNYN
jgi:BioD-like phosphotransacetylase family protein